MMETHGGSGSMETPFWREEWRRPIVRAGGAFAPAAALGIPCWVWTRLMAPAGGVSRLGGPLAWFLTAFGAAAAAFLWFGVGALCRDRAVQVVGLTLGWLAAVPGIALLRGQYAIHAAALLCLPPGTALLALRARRWRTEDDPVVR